MNIQAGKLEQHLPGRGERERETYECMAAPFWNQFICSGPWRLHNMQHKHRSGVKEQARPMEGEQDHNKTLKAPQPISRKVKKNGLHMITHLNEEQ